MQSQQPVWLSVDLARWLQRDLSSCAHTLLSFLMSEVRRIDAVKNPVRYPPPATTATAAAASKTAHPAAAAPAVVHHRTATGAAAALQALAQAQPAGLATAAVQRIAGALPLATAAARSAAASTPQVRKIGDTLTEPIEVSSSSAEAGNADGEEDGEEDDEEERIRLRTKAGDQGS
jgi:hypothetical protein